MDPILMITATSSKISELVNKSGNRILKIITIPYKIKAILEL